MLNIATYSMKFPLQPGKGSVPVMVAIGGKADLKPGSLPTWGEMSDDYYIFFNNFPLYNYCYSNIGIKKGWLVKNYKKANGYFNLLPANTSSYNGGTPIVNYDNTNVYGRSKCIPNIGFPGFDTAVALFTGANGLSTETNKHPAPNPTDFSSFIEYVKIKFQTEAIEDSYYKWVTTTYFNNYGSLLLENPTKKAMADFYNNTCILINYHKLLTYWSGFLSYGTLLAGTGQIGSQTIDNDYIFLLPKAVKELNIHMTANFYPKTNNLGYSEPPRGTYTFDTFQGKVEIIWTEGEAGRIVGDPIVIFKNYQFRNPSEYVRKDFYDLQRVNTPLDFRGDITIQDFDKPNSLVSLSKAQKEINAQDILRSLVYAK